MEDCDHKTTSTYDTDSYRKSSRSGGKDSGGHYIRIYTKYKTVKTHTRCNDCKRVIDTVTHPETGPVDT